MLTKEENERMTRVGPGTPGGEFLRRYWFPVSVAAELTDENPTKFIRILGENLVLFRDKSGRVGLIDDRCSHRGASLVYGRVEERGIACAYHGWLYDIEGNCLETPPEPAESKFRLTVKAKFFPPFEVNFILKQRCVLPEISVPAVLGVQPCQFHPNPQVPFPEVLYSKCRSPL